jgi:hypothetical protein
MGAHVGKVVNPNSKPLGHRSKRALHGGSVVAKGPRAASLVARQNHVHRTPHADRSFELTAPTPDGTTVLGSHQLSVHVAP